MTRAERIAEQLEIVPPSDAALCVRCGAHACECAIPRKQLALHLHQWRNYNLGGKRAHVVVVPGRPVVGAKEKELHHARAELDSLRRAIFALARKATVE